MAHEKEDLPVLNAVVRSGNASIIRSTRLGHEVLEELEALRADITGARPPLGDGLPSRQGAQGSLREYAVDGRPDDDLDDAFDDTLDEADTAPLGHSPALASRGESAGEVDLHFDVSRLLSIASRTPLVGRTESKARPASGSAADSHGDDADEDDELELLIDEVVDRHVAALRRDIRALLEEARRR